MKVESFKKLINKIKFKQPNLKNKQIKSISQKKNSKKINIKLKILSRNKNF